MDTADEIHHENAKLVQGEAESSCEKEPKADSNKADSENEPLLSDKDLVQPPTDDSESVSLDIDISAKKKELKLDLPSIVKEKQHIQKQQSSSGPLKIAVFVKKDRKNTEGGSYVLELDKGRSTTAGDIKDKMLELLAIPKSSAHLFAIWFISPYLELQMKCHHVPFYLRKQWRDLLKKLSSCPKDEECLDEPVLVFQRNSFITVAEEKKEKEHNVLKRLFEEASYNVLKARYPIPVADAEMLGGILLRCYEGAYNIELHKPGMFKKRLNEFLPFYAIGYNKISQYIRSSSTEQRLLAQYESASNTLNDKLACYKKFLEYCHSLEFYGCAFFKGSCFQEGTDFKIWKSELQSISIGLNRYGITLFKGETEEMLTHLAYNEFSWDYKQDDELDDDGAPIERFIIEYDDEDEVRQIQIISKQACLMDAMVQSCVNFINEIPVLNKGSVARKKVQNISYKSFTLSRPTEA